MLRLLIPVCMAVTIGTLESSVELLEQDLPRAIEFHEGLMRRDALWGGDELFPLLQGEEEQISDAGPFLTVRIDGLQITLKDVASNAWFAPFVRSVAERGVVSGYREASGQPTGYFGPANPVTVEQLAKMSTESTGIEEENCTGQPQNHAAVGRWSQTYILCAEEHDWAIFSDGSISIGRPATRAEVVVTVLQAYGISWKQATGDVFRDVPPSLQYASAIEQAAADNIVVGYRDGEGSLTGEFRPGDPVNRAEVAKIFALAHQRYHPY